MSNPYVVAFNAPAHVSPLALPGMQTSNPYMLSGLMSNLFKSARDDIVIAPGAFTDTYVFCHVPTPNALGWKYYGKVQDSDPDAEGFVTVNVVGMQKYDGVTLDASTDADAINDILKGSKREMKDDHMICEPITNLFLPGNLKTPIHVQTAKEAAVAAKEAAETEKKTAKKAAATEKKDAKKAAATEKKDAKKAAKKAAK